MPFYKKNCGWIILLGLLLSNQLDTNVVEAINNPWSMFQHDPQRSGKSYSPTIKQPILRWNYFTNSYIFASPVIDNAGKIYLTTEDGNLHIFTPSGEKEKTITIGVKIDSTPAISKEGNIYIGLSDGHILSFNAEGKNQWIYSTESGIKSSSLVLSDDEEIIFVGCEDGTLHAINKDGSLKWKYQTSSSIHSSPAVNQKGIIYVGCNDGTLYAIKKDGSLVFKKEIKNSTFSSPVIDSEGNIYVGCSNRNIAVLTKEGDIRSIPVNATIYSSPLIGEDGSIYIGTEEGLYGITPKGVWCAKTGKIFNSTPAMSSEGIIYTASFDGKIYAIEPKEGRIVWSYDIGFGPTSLAIDQKGTIYVGSRDKNLYAIGSTIIPTPKEPEISIPQIPKKEVKKKIEMTPPASPTDLVITPLSSQEVRLNWQDNADNETEFRIYRKLQEDITYTLIKTLPPNSHSFLDTNLQPGTTYIYRVVACNQMGFCKYSAQSEVLTKSLLPSLPPKSPLELKVGTFSSTQVSLSWVDNSDNEEGFYIERKLKNEYILIATLKPNITTFQDVTLSPNTTYSYRVAAYNSVGVSAYSNEITITTKVILPTAPQSLKVINFSTTTVSLSWCDSSDNEQGFIIERDKRQITTLPSNRTSFQDINLVPGTSYSYRILTFNDAGNSEYSNEVQVTTKNTPPLPPSNLVATSVSADKIILSWQDNSDNELGFRLERKKPKEEYKLIEVIPSNTTTSKDIEVTPLTTYFYRISAYNDAGLSAYTKEIKVTTQDAIPLLPTDLQASPLSQNSIKLSWCDNSNNELGFKLERALPLQKYVPIKVLLPDTTSYIDTGLIKDTTYFYRVKAYNKLGDSDYSNTIGVRTLDVLPAPPTNLTGISKLSSLINLTWQDNSDNEVGFKIERRLQSDFAYTQIALLDKDITTYQDSDLRPNTTYCYRVRAYNRSGNSQYSNLLTITTLPVIPFVPTNLKNTPVSSNQINLSWQDNSDNEQGFKIERKRKGERYEEIAITSANITTYEDKTLEPTTTYYYRVRAYNQAGNSSYSNEQEATTLDTLPYSPSHLQTKPISPIQIDLSWQDNSNNEQGFKIERSLDGKNYTQIALLLANTTNYQDKNLLQNTTYYYRVKAYNSLGDSGYSNEAWCKTLDVVPSTPTNLKTIVLLPDKIKLTWEDNSNNELGFKIERKRKDDTIYSQLDTVGKDITEYYDKGILPNVTYLYRVCSYNEEGKSAYTNESFAKITQVIPEKPTSLQAESISHYEIVLSWEDNSNNESGFKIERKSIDDKRFVQIAVTFANTTSYHDIELCPNTIYYYFVRAYNEAGDSDYSNIASAKTYPAPTKSLSKIQPKVEMPEVEIDSPTLLWTFPTKARICGSNPTIDSEGKIYLGSEDSSLYCISSAGELVWSYSTQGKINTSPTIGVDGEIYVVSGDKNLYAILPDGTFKWKYPLKVPTEASCLITPKLDIQVFTSNGNVYSIHPDGRLCWLTSLDGGIITHTPSIDDKGNIYIGAKGVNGGLFCFDANGGLKWKYIEAGEAVTSPVIDSNGNIYIGLNHILYCFNSEGGRRFKIEHEKNCWMTSSPVISSDGVIYYNIGLSSQEGYLRALTQSGKILWAYPIGWSDISPIIDSRGNIYVISKDYNLSCLSKDGKLKWNYTLDSKISTSPVLGKDGTIYIGANNGLLYAIGEGDDNPPITPSNVMTEVVSSSEINISWEDNSNDELGFIIERRSQQEDVYSQLTILPPNTTTYQDNNLLPFTTYYYRIKAFNKNGDSGYSNPSYSMTLTLPPSLPTGISIIPLKEGGKLKLIWQKPKEKEFSHIQIYRSIVKDKLGNLIADGLRETTYVDSSIVNNLPYYYTFFAYDIYGNKSVPSLQYVGMAQDNIYPEIINYSPVGTNISCEVPITITFSEKMDKESVKESFSITPHTQGTFTWEGNKFFFIPLSNLAGNTKYTIKVLGNAKDIAGNYLQKSLTFQFTTLNPSPIIWGYKPLDLSPRMVEGESLSFEVYASDPNYDYLRYSWKLDGVEKSTTNTWTYTAGTKDAGIKTLILSISDGTSLAIQKWTITVIDRNLPPTLSLEKEEITINVNELIQFNISASDPDDDPLIYTTSMLPQGATFSPRTKIFSWCPNENQAGTYQIIFKVSDGKDGEDAKELKINVNLPPRIE